MDEDDERKIAKPKLTNKSGLDFKRSIMSVWTLKTLECSYHKHRDNMCLSWLEHKTIDNKTARGQLNTLCLKTLQTPQPTNKHSSWNEKSTPNIVSRNLLHLVFLKWNKESKISRSGQYHEFAIRMSAQFVQLCVNFNYINYLKKNKMIILWSVL